MEPLKRLENRFGIIRLESQSIVPNGEDPFRPTLGGPHVNAWGLCAAELAGVFYQVAEDGGHCEKVSLDGWQRIVSDDRGVFLQFFGNLQPRLRQNGVETDLR